MQFVADQTIRVTLEGVLKHAEVPRSGAGDLVLKIGNEVVHTWFMMSGSLVAPFNNANIEIIGNPEPPLFSRVIGTHRTALVDPHKEPATIVRVERPHERAQTHQWYCSGCGEFTSWSAITVADNG